MRPEARILVTDDDPAVLLLSTTLLVDEGYEICEATTGKGCLEAARLHHPDIVLLDVVLPDMTGVEVCRQIKAEPVLQGTFVILVSGSRVSSDYQAEALDVGADGYIVNGVANREFLPRIRFLLRIKRAEDALREKGEEQEKLISKLLAKTATLKGLIPICASCKKIRDNEGYWDQVETYIGKRTGALFSHGICPECAEKLYPEYYKRQ